MSAQPHLQAQPLVWGHGPRTFEVFLEPTCPFSVRAFNKLDELLDEVGADNVTIKIRLQSQPWHLFLRRHRALHSCRLDAPARQRAGAQGVKSRRRPSRRV
ncbi:Uncharacterised protein [Raoultella ornithinolytica]|nr:Uncharacterised protein [Raoultella ornithinolytica]